MAALQGQHEQALAQLRAQLEDRERRAQELERELEAHKNTATNVSHDQLDGLASELETCQKVGQNLAYWTFRFISLPPSAPPCFSGPGGRTAQI